MRNNNIKLATFWWLPLERELTEDETTKQDEYIYSINESKLKEMLTQNNYFKNKYKSYNDFIENYQLEDTANIYQMMA